MNRVTVIVIKIEAAVEVEMTKPCMKGYLTDRKSQGLSKITICLAISCI